MEENIETETPERLAEKARVAALARERTARRNALGLNARGKPKKDRHNKNRDDAKQTAGVNKVDVVGPIRHQECQPLSTQEAATPKRRGDPSHSDVQFQKS